MFSLKIALRYLFSKKAHNAVNIISVISICGVVVATAAIVCVLSVFNGFRGLIMSKLASLDPQVAVTATMGKTIGDADSVLAVVRQVPGVQAAVPVVEDHALAVFAKYQMPVRVKGVPTDYNRLNSIDKVIVDGRFMLADQVSRYAVIGVGPALQLHVRPDYLLMMQIYAPQRQGRINMANPLGAFRADSLFVSGIFQVQNDQYDDDVIFVPIDMARSLFDYTAEATQIELALTPQANEKEVMQALAVALGPGYAVKNRLMQQAESFRMVNVEKWMAFLLLAFILIIATFNVISTLALLIIEKDESISTLRNLGATRKQIARVFVAQAWLISLAGAVVGIVLGLALCVGQQYWGWLKLAGNPANMIVNAYPVQVLASDLLLVLALVLLVALVTCAVTWLIIRQRMQRFY